MSLLSSPDSVEAGSKSSLPADDAMWNGVVAWPDYLVDAFQRGVLFLDLLRRRGAQEIEIESQPMATVLNFEHEVIMSGRVMPRPMNYYLARISPLAGAHVDNHKRPVVVIDPRAGQGPGIGGFKALSEIGDALNAGHPVYFIGFSAEPEPGQQFLDVVEGQVAFFEHVVALHADAPRPFAIGNCQAGYQTLMVAMLRPDLFGPILVAGSPMSFWQGVRGKNPMRYAGGLLGGSWLTAMTSDLGNGSFDGSWLVMNFDKLGPSAWLWGKQYEVYANVDTAGERYLQFEKWWGDFIELSGAELQFLVDNLFIGDKLTRNQLTSHEGTVFDVRTISAPIIVFTSLGDNISPPQETLGWIPDLYKDVEAIRAADRTIVYCVDQKIGHLAIFVSSKVAAVEDQAFVQLIDVIECLPPGLFEMVLTPCPVGKSSGMFTIGDSVARFESRSMSDICAYGRNTLADERAFAAVARVSERNLAAYRMFVQPMLRALTTKSMADLAKAMNPMRLSYTMFAGHAPWMKYVQKFSDKVAAARKPLAENNPFLAVQTRLSEQISDGLETYRKLRDMLQEQVFFGVYGSPFLQASLGIDARNGERPVPALTADMLAAQTARAAAHEHGLRNGGFDAALIRSVLYVTGTNGWLDQSSATALKEALRQLPDMQLPAFKLVVRAQSGILVSAAAAAVTALAVMVVEALPRKRLVEQVNAIAGAGGPLPAEATDRLSRIAKILGVAQVDVNES